jgi:outer membrane protein assembly factor BamB
MSTLAAFAADQAQWGERFSGNLVSKETGLPESFDLKTGKNVKWVVPLGSESYAPAVISQGKVFVGTNNRKPRDPRRKGDRGVLLCLDEKDGSLIWQLVIAKIEGDVYKDWYGSGICSPVTVEGDRVYVLSNRGELLCLDIHGMKNGNDGPFKDEAPLMVQSNQKPIPLNDKDADIIWRFDIHKGAGTWPHDAAHGSILIDGDLLYVNTGNGVDNTHRKIRRPDGPSLIVVDKKTGRYVARDQEGIGPRIFHCTWSSPSLGTVKGKRCIFFGGGDGVCYAFKALKQPVVGKELKALEKIWSFDCDPTAPKTGPDKYRKNRREGPSLIKSMPVFVDGKVYITAGGDIWWGKRFSWLKCIDASGTGDITKTGQVWSYELKRHCSATPSIHDGLAYISDCGGLVHCVDAATGKAYWTHKAGGQMWGSTLVADGKVYVGTRSGTFWVLAAGKEKKVLGKMELDSGVSRSPTVANGVVYIATMEKLYAIHKQ